MEQNKTSRDISRMAANIIINGTASDEQRNILLMKHIASLEANTQKYHKQLQDICFDFLVIAGLLGKMESETVKKVILDTLFKVASQGSSIGNLADDVSETKWCVEDFYKAIRGAYDTLPHNEEED